MLFWGLTVVNIAHHVHHLKLPAIPFNSTFWYYFCSSPFLLKSFCMWKRGTLQWCSCEWMMYQKSSIYSVWEAPPPTCGCCISRSPVGCVFHVGYIPSSICVVWPLSIQPRQVLSSAGRLQVHSGSLFNVKLQLSKLQTKNEIHHNYITTSHNISHYLTTSQNQNLRLKTSWTNDR